VSDILDSFPDVPVKFWVCPDHRGRVEWTGKVATCLECGRTNQPATVPSTSDEDVYQRAARAVIRAARKVVDPDGLDDDDDWLTDEEVQRVASDDGVRAAVDVAYAAGQASLRRERLTCDISHTLRFVDAPLLRPLLVEAADKLDSLITDLAAAETAHDALAAARAEIAAQAATIAKIREAAIRWAALAPVDDWGDTPHQTVTVDRGRAVLHLLDGTDD